LRSDQKKKGRKAGTTDDDLLEHKFVDDDRKTYFTWKDGQRRSPSSLLDTTI
jgi:hypothetical protein